MELDKEILAEQLDDKNSNASTEKLNCIDEHFNHIIILRGEQ
ncbi:MAG: hypothetical protein QHH13_10565 [Melioribacter sp.]|nr:hypothetical protein [Melioribacter sp.]